MHSVVEATRAMAADGRGPAIVYMYTSSINAWYVEETQAVYNSGVGGGRGPGPVRRHRPGGVCT
jgi:hypothetical protein